MQATMVENPETQQLVERARNGDRAAFDRLASTATPTVLASIRQRIGPALREEIDPEDVLQETLLRAFRSLVEFRWQGHRSFERWLRGIAANYILHSARQRGIRKHLRIEREPQAAEASPSRQQRREERFDRLKRSIASLDADYRTVVQLARIEGLRIREIASRMKRSESSVRNLLFRAMQQLRQSFGDTESLNLPDRWLGESSGGTDDS